MKGGRTYEFVRDRQRYEALITRYRDVLPPYFLPLWLDAVCGKEGWQPLYLQATSLTGNSSPSFLLFPYYKPVSGHITPAPFTQYLGPFFLSENPRMDISPQMLAMLVDDLKSLHSIHIHTPPSLTDWLPFHQAGYKQTTRYTHILQLDMMADDPLRHHAKTMLCRKVRQGEKYGLVLGECSVDELVRLSTLSIVRSGDKLSYPSRLKALIQQTLSVGIGRIHAALTPCGRVAAAVFIVSGGGGLYYIAGGQDLSLSPNAHAYCLYNALGQEAKIRKARFVDFEGSMIPGVAYYFRSFGASPVPYFAISRGRMGLGSRLVRRLGRIFS